jgi:hypothetical protein
MALRSAREKRFQTIGQKLESVIMLVLAGNRAIIRHASRPATETHRFNTSLRGARRGTSPEVVAKMWRSHASRSAVPHGR